MNSKLIMTASAVLLAVIGITFTFLPDEIIAYMDVNHTRELQLLIQLSGALYFGFAILNWMGKGSIMGGIYGRPLVMANFGHFMIGGLALAKGVMKNTNLHYATCVLAGSYVLFAILFGMILFRNPKSPESRKAN